MSREEMLAEAVGHVLDVSEDSNRISDVSLEFLREALNAPADAPTDPAPGPAVVPDEVLQTVFGQAVANAIGYAAVANVESAEDAFVEDSVGRVFDLLGASYCSESQTLTAQVRSRDGSVYLVPVVISAGNVKAVL